MEYPKKNDINDKYGRRDPYRHVKFDPLRNDEQPIRITLVLDAFQRR
jgi:hypothetical protein